MAPSTRTTATKAVTKTAAPRAPKATRHAAEDPKPAAGTRNEHALALGRELEALRLTCREMVQAYELRVGALLAAAAEALSPAAGDAGRRLPSAARLEAALAAIGKVTVKPAKGRPKDFARLLALAETLVDTLHEES